MLEMLPKKFLKGKEIKISGEIENFLGKEPLKQMISTLYSLQRLPKSQIDEITEKFPHILKYIDLPLDLLNRYILTRLKYALHNTKTELSKDWN